MKKTNEDFRLEEISNILIEYSLGNFDVQLPLSQNGDDIDAIIAGVNMLGEELKYVTFSRDYLNRVYNSIAQMLFVADLSGVIKNVNTAACGYLDKTEFDIIGKNLFDFIKINGKHNVFSDKQLSGQNNEEVILNGEVVKSPNIKLKCNFTTLNDVAGNPIGILLVAEDVTEKMATEKLLIRAIIDTQEKERNRFASDLHDSLGQQLSGIRFYISALQANADTNDRISKQFDKTLNTIDGAIVELRDICFNLMPRTLENHTLKYSLGELASKFNLGEHMMFKLTFNENVPKLVKAFEIACFRIVQEFLNNALKHGKATMVSVDVKCSNKKKTVKLILKENGVGFNAKSFSKVEGMGLKNIRTRVESYYGSLEIKSKIGKGTTMTMDFPKAFVILPSTKDETL